MLLQLIKLDAAVVFLVYSSVVGGCLFFVSTAVVSWALTVQPPKGLRRLGIRGQSNLADQHDTRYTKEDASESETPRIKALFIHPVKSCKRVELQRALLTKIGFAYDRCFAFATEEQDLGPDNTRRWQMVSQRTKPQLSQVEVELWVPHNDSDHVDPMRPEGGCLIMSFPNPYASKSAVRLLRFLETWSWSAQPQIRFKVPLMPTARQIAQYGIKEKPFIILGRTARGLDLAGLPEVATILPQLKTFLHIPAKRGLTLLRCTPDTLHRTADNLAPLENIGTRAMHGFTDDQPVHLINLASVHAVSQLVPVENQPLNALRFRANMYITGPPTYDEEEWKRIRISTRDSMAVNPRLSVVCRSCRCTIPNVNPNSGLVTRENPVGDKKKGKPQPSTTMIEHRMVETTNSSALGYMGIHCVPEDSTLEEAKVRSIGMYVEVGDTFEILETGVHVDRSTGNDY